MGAASPHLPAHGPDELRRFHATIYAELESGLGPPCNVSAQRMAISVARLQSSRTRWPLMSTASGWGLESAEFRAQEGAPRLGASPQREARDRGCAPAEPAGLQKQVGRRGQISWATAGLAPRAQLVPSEFLLVIPARVPCPAEKSTLRKTQLQPGAPRHGCLRVLVEDKAKLRLFGSADLARTRDRTRVVGCVRTHTHTQAEARRRREQPENTSLKMQGYHQRCAICSSL